MKNLIPTNTLPHPLSNCIIISALILSLLSCKDEKHGNRTNKIDDSISTNLQVDHFNIWVKNPKKAKERLTKIGFASVLLGLEWNAFE